VVYHPHVPRQPFLNVSLFYKNSKAEIPEMTCKLLCRFLVSKDDHKIDITRPSEIVSTRDQSAENIAIVVVRKVHMQPLINQS
jgi:hypothetical protein